jgi:maltose O-acetyltransferase
MTLMESVLSVVDSRTRLRLAEGIFRFCPNFVGARSAAMALRAAGVRLGKASVFFGFPTLSGPGDVCSRLQIGAECGFNFGCHFELDADIAIADHVSVGHEVLFLTREHDASDPARRGAVCGARPIRIEAGAWLGSRCVIMPGVTIGAGSVVGASVVVRDDLPPNTLFTGARRLSIAKWGLARAAAP